MHKTLQPEEAGLRKLDRVIAKKVINKRSKNETAVSGRKMAILEKKYV